MLIIKNTKTIDLRYDWYMYKPYNIEKNDGFSVLSYLGCNLDRSILHHRYSCRQPPCLYMFREHTGYWNSDLYLKNLNNISQYLNIILRNYKDLKRLNSVMKIKVLPMLHKGPCHPWLHVHWKEPSVFVQTPLLHGDVRHSSISTNIKN